MSNAKLVRESYSEQIFGNAEAVYRLGNLLFYFVRDRDDDMLSVGSSSSPQQFFDIDDVAVWMGWLSLEEISAHGSRRNFDEPPLGPILSLNKALRLIKSDWDKLDKAFSTEELVSTRAQLSDIEGQRISAQRKLWTSKYKK